MPDADYSLVGELENALIIKALDEIEKGGDKMANSLDKNAQRMGKALDNLVGESKRLVASGQDAGEVLKDALGAKSVGEAAKEIRKINSEVKQLTANLSETAKTDAIKEALNVQEANQRLKTLSTTIDTLFATGNKEAMTFANTLKLAATNAVQLKAQGVTTSQQLNKELATLNTTANRMAKNFQEDVPEGVERSHISLWKLGNTFDRLGVQGAGSTIRIVDALRGIHPAVIAGAVGIGALVVVLNKLGQVAVDVANKVKDIFVQVVTDSVETSKKFEILERQLGNIFRGNEQAAVAFFDFLLEKSAQFGVDLTKIAPILVPEAGSLEELEKAFQIASTLSVAFGRTVEEAARAIKQGQAGLFRSLQEQFGLLGTDVQVIQDLQEEYGAFEGLLLGIDKFLERTGRQWDTFEGTLVRVMGTFQVLREIAQNTLGEPIKDELTGQLNKIIDFIEENGQEIEDLAFAIGDAVANIIGQVGNIGGDFLGDFDSDKFLTVLEQAEAFASQLVGLFGDIFGEAEFDGLTGIMLSTLELAEDITLEIRNWVAFVQFYLGFLEDANRLMDIISEKTGISRDLVGGEDVGSILGIPRAEIIEEERRALDELQKARREEIEGRREATDAALDEADAILGVTNLLDEYREALVAAAEAQETLTEAEEEAQSELNRREEELKIDLIRKKLDLEIQAAEERRKIEQDLLDDLEESYSEYLQDIEDEEISSGRKLEDIDIEFSRKQADIDIERVKERLQIEDDYLKKLQEIRRRADFQASEAIRNNDAVALLRIRRQMRFDLETAKRNRDDDLKDADKKAEEKRDNLKEWLKREEEDAKLSSDRKQQDLELAFQRRNQAINDQYNKELRDQNIQERLRIEALKLWRAREKEDLKVWWDYKLKEIEARYKEEIEIIRKYEALKLEIIAGAAGGTSTLPGQIPPPPGDTGNGAAGGGETAAQIAELRRKARELAIATGNTELIQVINTITDAARLREIIAQLQQQLSNTGNGPGGTMPVGQIPTPSAPLTNVPTPAVMGPAINNRNLSVIMQLNDPSQLSPIQIAMMQQIATEQILAHVL